MKINLFKRLELYRVLPKKCRDCDSEYKEISNGSCVQCRLQGYMLDKELGNNANVNDEYDEDCNPFIDEYHSSRECHERQLLKWKYKSVL